MLRHYYIQNVNDGNHVRVYEISKEIVAHLSQFISVKLNKILRKSKVQCQKKLRKLRLKQNDHFLVKKNV